MLLMLAGCGDGGCRRPEKKQVPPHEVFIVLCDMSGTVGYPEVLDNIIQHAAEIAEQMPVNATAHYLAIEDRDYNRRLISVTKEMPRVLKAKEQKEIMRSFDAFPDSVRRAVAAFAPSYQNTCITHAIGRAYELALEERTLRPDARIKLVILSDMVEECPSIVIGQQAGIDFRLGTPTERMAQFSFLQEVEREKVFFGRFDPEIYVIFESRNEHIRLAGQKVTIYRWELQELWLALFPHFGIDKGPVHFSVADLPAQMFTTNHR